MAKIELEYGESVTITFAQSDGEIKVSFANFAITVIADMPDKSGREGIIYEETFKDTPDNALGVAIQHPSTTPAD